MHFIPISEKIFSAVLELFSGSWNERMMGSIEMVKTRVIFVLQTKNPIK